MTKKIFNFIIGSLFFLPFTAYAAPDCFVTVANGQESVLLGEDENRGKMVLYMLGNQEDLVSSEHPGTDVNCFLKCSPDGSSDTTCIGLYAPYVYTFPEVAVVCQAKSQASIPVKICTENK